MEMKGKDKKRPHQAANVLLARRQGPRHRSRTVQVASKCRVRRMKLLFIFRAVALELGLIIFGPLPRDIDQFPVQRAVSTKEKKKAKACSYETKGPKQTDRWHLEAAGLEGMSLRLIQVEAALTGTYGSRPRWARTKGSPGARRVPLERPGPQP